MEKELHYPLFYRKGFDGFLGVICRQLSQYRHIIRYLFSRI